MAAKIASKALMSNPALKPFEVFVGKWQTTGSHPYFPGITLRGRVSVEWLEGGAFLVLRSDIDHPEFPNGVEIFGSDDIAKEFFMLHFDERGVSRKYNVSMTGNQLKWWRDDPNFSQRFSLIIEDGNKMVGKGEMSREGAAWESDLSLTFERLQ